MTLPKKGAEELKENFAGVLVHRTSNDNLHAILFYKEEIEKKNRINYLHVGWENYLSNRWNDPSAPSLWASPDVEPERLRSVSNLCDLIFKEYKRTKKFPYGIKYEGSKFSGDGKLLLGQGARGLTCATFILAIFNSFGIEMINESEWPIRQEDDRNFLRFLRSVAPSETNVIEKLEEEVELGCKRFYPEEVLSACCCPIPATFSQIREKIGSGIGDLLAEHVVKPSGR